MRMSAALGALCLVFLLCRPAAAASLFAPADSATIDAATSQALKEPLDDLIADVGHLHPVAMMFLAKRLFDAGREDEAVFWFYEGQLRWKAHLLANKDQMEIAMFERLHADIGPDINQYAFADPDALLATIDKVLDWDSAHPDALTPAGPEKDSIRKGLADFKDYIVAHKDEIAKTNAQRNANATPGDPYSGSGGALFGTPEEMVRDYDPSAFAAFRIGVTVKTDVVKALGKPEWWETEKDGTSAFGYSFHRSDPTSARLGLVQRVTVSFNFDAKGILRAINLPPDKKP